MVTEIKKPYEPSLDELLAPGTPTRVLADRDGESPDHVRMLMQRARLAQESRCASR